MSKKKVCEISRNGKVVELPYIDSLTSYCTMLACYVAKLDVQRLSSCFRILAWGIEFFFQCGRV